VRRDSRVAVFESGGGSGLVARPVFKTAMGMPLAAPVGSIPTRSRHRHLVRGLLWLLLVALPPSVAQAQTDSTAAPPDTSLMARPIKPLKAFFMSLAVPGWAQARLDRKLTAGLFVAWEGVSLGMTMKTIQEVGYLTRIEADSARLANKRQERQDWLFILGFNHLFSGLEAFVSSQLHEFPADVRLRAYPGMLAAEVRVAF